MYLLKSIVCVAIAMLFDVCYCHYTTIEINIFVNMYEEIEVHKWKVRIAVWLQT